MENDKYIGRLLGGRYELIDVVGVGNIDQSGNAGVFCAFFNFGQKFTTAIDFRG